MHLVDFVGIGIDRLDYQTGDLPAVGLQWIDLVTSFSTFGFAFGHGLRNQCLSGPDAFGCGRGREREREREREEGWAVSVEDPESLGRTRQSGLQE